MPDRDRAVIRRFDRQGDSFHIRVEIDGAIFDASISATPTVPGVSPQAWEEYAMQQAVLKAADYLSPDTLVKEVEGRAYSVKELRKDVRSNDIAITGDGGSSTIEQDTGAVHITGDGR